MAARKSCENASVGGPFGVIADTPEPTQKQTAGTADHEDDDAPTIAELEEAVKAAQAEVDDLKERRAKLKQDIADRKIAPVVQAEYDAAKQAYDDAKAATATAVQAVTAAEAELKKVTEDPASTEQQKADATKAVDDAVKKRDEATATEKTAKERFDAADEARVDAHVALTQAYSRLGEELETAEGELAEAKDELEFWESIGEECKEDSSLSFSLTGPEKIAAGGSGIFTLSLSNGSDRELDDVQAYPGVAVFGDEDEDEADPEHPKALDRATIEWSSEDVLYASAMYWNDDRSCGIGEKVVEAWFDVTGTETVEPTPSEKPTVGTETPTPEPSPSPSTSTSTPTPAATSSNSNSNSNTNTNAQGGSSNTAVSGELAETGSSDAMPKLAAAAGAAVVLGAGALFLTRRRRADA